jgi:hypothetical protein
MMARSTTRSNQRPDTLMQDCKADRSRKPLATHGRTIHRVIQRTRSREAAYESIIFGAGNDLIELGLVASP